MQKFFSVLFLSLLLAGCGFHLQGSRPLPEALQKISVEYKQPFDVIKPPLLGFLQQETERRGGWVVTTPDAAIGKLRILKLEHDRELLSVSPATGKRIETLYRTAVEFDFQRDGKVVLPQQRLVVFRELFFDNREVIPNEYEVEEIREQMQRELAQLMLLRLETQLASAAQ